MKIDSGYNLSLFDDFVVKDRRALSLKKIYDKSFEGALNYSEFLKEWIEEVNLQVDMRLLSGAFTELLLYCMMINKVSYWVMQPSSSSIRKSSSICTTTSKLLSAMIPVCFQ